MRCSFLSTALVSITLTLLLGVGVCFGADYLVIKKKDGSLQRVPLQFDPEQIESFGLETVPGPKTPKKPGAPDAAGQPAPAPGVPQAEPAPKQMEIKPGEPGPKPMILREAPRKTQPPPSTQPGAQPPAKPTAEPGGPVGGPALPAVQGGQFSVNVYKLPENVKALPDFSALKPVNVIRTDAINLNPMDGGNQPSPLPEDTQGLGMRFHGTFMVSGEGIFKWRLLSRDGARLHIDDKTLIDNDGLHKSKSKTAFVYLAEGIHSIIVDHFNSAGPPVLQMFVTPPEGGEKIFSASAGLQGWKEPQKPYDVLWGQVYFVPKDAKASRPDFGKISPIGRVIAPALDISGGGGIPGLPTRKDHVALRYEGFFKVDGSGIFAFRLLADDYAKLTVSKQKIIESSKFGKNGKTAWAFLQQGVYPISVEYFHQTGDPLLQLFVTAPEGQEMLFTPSTALKGFKVEGEGVNAIPAFVYFVKPGTKKLPNFNKASPAGVFYSKAIDFPVDRGTREFPGAPKRDSWLGLRFYVKFSLSAEEAGKYKWRVVSRDAARLIIGKKIVVNAPGIGRLNDKSGNVTLNKGSHEMFLDYLQTTGPSALQLYVTAPNGEEKIFAFQ